MADTLSILAFGDVSQEDIPLFFVEKFVRASSGLFVIFVKERLARQAAGEERRRTEQLVSVARRRGNDLLGKRDRA